MIAVYKYTLNLIRRQELLIPQNAKILHIGEQNSQITLWAQVNTSEDKTKLPIFIFGTGHPIPSPDLEYIGTVQMTNGLVSHVFMGPLI